MEITKTRYRAINVTPTFPFSGQWAQNYAAYKVSLLIEDYKHYIQNEEDIKRWMIDSGINYMQQGMLIFFKHADDQTAFLMRWG